MQLEISVDSVVLRRAGSQESVLEGVSIKLTLPDSLLSGARSGPQFTLEDFMSSLACRFSSEPWRDSERNPGESELFSRMRNAFEKARREDEASEGTSKEGPSGLGPYPLDRKDFEKYIIAEENGGDLCVCGGGLNCPTDRWPNLIRHYRERIKVEYPWRKLSKMEVVTFLDFEKLEIKEQMEYVSLLSRGVRGPDWAEKMFFNAQRLLQLVEERYQGQVSTADQGESQYPLSSDDFDSIFDAEKAGDVCAGGLHCPKHRWMNLTHKFISMGEVKECYEIMVEMRRQNDLESYEGFLHLAPELQMEFVCILSGTTGPDWAEKMFGDTTDLLWTVEELLDDEADPEDEDEDPEEYLPEGGAAKPPLFVQYHLVNTSVDPEGDGEPETLSRDSADDRCS